MEGDHEVAAQDGTRRRGIDKSSGSNNSLRAFNSSFASTRQRLRGCQRAANMWPNRAKERSWKESQGRQIYAGIERRKGMTPRWQGNESNARERQKAGGKGGSGERREKRVQRDGDAEEIKKW